MTADSPSPTAAKRRRRVAQHPTSYAQRRMWFLHEFEPHTPVYNLPFGFRYQEELRLSVLQRALDEIVRRHEALRTTFAVDDGEPVQVVASERAQHIEVVDLRQYADGQRQLEAQRRASMEAMAPFDLERGPLLRATVVMLDEADQLLMFTMHHIVSDGWSVSLFLNELTTLLVAYGSGEPSPLEELPAQYPDYARWQRERLEGAALDALLDYWRERLDGAPAVIELPLDRPRPKHQSFAGATLPVMLERELLDGLRRLSKAQGVTLFMALLAGFTALLHRYCGQPDIVVGTPVALRGKPEFETLIGLFVNTLVLRLDFSGQTTTEELLGQVLDVTVDAYSHQELPFEQLVEELQPDRSLSHQPIVQAVLALQTVVAKQGPLASDEPAAPAEAAEVPAEPATPVPSTAKFDLTLSFVESDYGLAGAAEYNVDIFDAPTIHGFIQGLRRLLSAMVAEPHRPLATLPLLDGAERQQILAAYNPQRRIWDSGATVVERIWAWAERDPDAVAVIVDGGAETTYRELVTGAEEVARRLRARGGVSGQLVPVCFHRSAELLTAVLGVQRAGAAYVPLDPGHPQARLEYMIESIGAAVALVAEGLEEQLAAIEVEVVVVPPPAASAPAAGAAVLGDSASGERLAFPSLDHLAYAIFTSGSTGKPKCAANPHDAFVNRLLWMQEAFPLAAGDRVLQKTPYTFDVSVWELFWPLMTGATVVFAVPEQHGDPAYLAEVIDRHQISIVHFVPSMLRSFLEHPQSRRCTSLRWVVASGEALSPDLVPMFYSRLGAELHNLYGPTECAIDVSHWHCRREVPAPVVPIGYPIANLRLHILQPDTLEPVPAGARGELFLAGAGVGNGYVGRPDLTAERFLPDPFAAEPSARMYRSGDLARYRADGSIEFLGRVDHQLKVRGFRIEAAEVEGALCRHPAVLDAVVTVRSAGGSDQRLVAHCVIDPAAGSVMRSLLRYERQGLLEDRFVEEMENGLSVVAKNRGETSFLYDEIFVDASYLQHGIDLRPGSVVFDVGANIGMFALYVGSRCPGAQVFAFEPIPEIHQLLAMNVGLYDWDWQVAPLPIALGREPGSATFTYYPHVSILSGRYAEHEEEREVILAFEANRGIAGPDLEELVGSQLEARTVECRVSTISSVLAENGLDRIDLLKIDVEKSEHDVLAGIDDQDWAKIRQVVVEVHEIDGRVAEVCELLRRQGFEVILDQESMLSGSSVSMVFGRRLDVGAEDAAGPAMERGELAPLPATPSRLRDQVRRMVAEQLPEYMVPSEILWLEALPRLTSGKVDRKSLPAGAPWLDRSFRSQQAVAPQTATELHIAQICAEVLGRENLGLHESFFDLGGHSLLATSVVSRLRDAFGVEVSLRDFFDEPTVAGLTRWVESGDARTSDLPPAIVRRGPDDPAPLSFTQQRVWFLDRFSPGDASYNIPVLLPMPGHIDPAILERALSEIARRHEILRTSFPFVDGEPVQRVAPDGKVQLRSLDVSSMAPDLVQNEVHGLVLKEIQRPFDLAHGPIVRALLIRSTVEVQILVLTMHHIVTDGWSMSILYRELATIYDAFSRGQPSPLPELPVQFADFALWQRRWLSGEALERQFEYWRQNLDGAPKLLDLPTDFPRPALQSTRGDIYIFDIEPAIYGDLSTLAKKEGCTPFMAFLAAYSALFCRLCGTRDVSVGSPIANRQLPELEGLIGFFSNTILLRTHWQGDPSFLELLRTAREVTLGAYAHQDMPFEHLVLELEAERAMDRTPLFQVMLILQNFEGWDSTGLSQAPPIDTGTAKFDLSLYLLPSGAGLTGQLEYCVDLFTRQTVASMMEQYCELLSQIVLAPEAPISSLALKGVDELPSPATLPPPELLTARIARLAEQSPERLAVRCGGQEWTYGELDFQARRLARRLAAAGIVPGELVGVAIGPSVELVVALLAIDRLGAAYLVVHPQDPPARVAALLGEGARAVLVGEEPAAGVGNLIEIDVTAAEPVPKLAAPAVGLVLADRCATVIAVWGAEGPKRIELDRTWLAGRLDRLPLRGFAGQRVACATEPGADGATWLLAALYHGCCLILPQRDPAVATRTFSRTLKKASAEVLITPPRILSTLASEFARSLATVEIIVELVDPEQLQQLQKALPAKLFGSCTWALQVGEYGWLKVAPSALGDGDLDLDLEAGEVVRILGEDLRLAPLGAYGELGFASPGLAVLADSLPVPSTGAAVQDDARSHLLRTGVRVIRSASGAVKLRGAGELLRLSAADVEFALRACDGVAEALVAFDRPLEGPAAFVIKQPEARGLAIREQLATWLRPEQIPRTIRFSAEYPLRSDGKIDLRVLRRSHGSAVEYVAPRTEIEHGIARMWTEALGIDKVGVHHDFFVLGGHSLLATHFLATLSMAFGVDIPLRTLFENPTIEALARLVDELAKADTQARVPALERASEEGPAPLSFAQQRLWFLDRYEPDSPLYNIVGALPLRLELDLGSLQRAVDTVVERHEALRTVFEVVDWEPVQRVEPKVEVPIEAFDLRRHPAAQRPAELARLTGEIAQASFDLSRAPLLRLALVRLADADYVLLMSIHHIVADGWSLDIFNQELGLCYAAYVAGETAYLPELPVQYTDYARWQRSWLTGEVLGRHIAYWRQLLAGAPPLLQLPADHPRRPAQGFAGHLHRTTFGADLVAPLRDLSQSEGATTFMVLLAAFASLLSRYTGRTDLVVGTPFGNRNRPELARMIGFVANTMALRFDLSGEVSFRRLIERVRTVVLESYEYQETPFDKLVEELQPDRDPSFSPLFQVSFGHRTLGERASAPAPEDMAPSEQPRTGTAKFDFSLSLLETSSQIACEIECKAELFSAATAKRFADHYQRLLRAVLQDPDRSLGDYDLLDEDQRALALAAPVRLEIESAAHHRVLEMAARHPERIAVRTTSGELSYAELAARSSHCAAALQATGIEPGEPVGVYVTDPIQELVAALGVLRVGGTWVPLSRLDSRSRLSARLEQAAAEVLITTGDAASYLGQGRQVLALDALPPDLAEPNEVRVDLDAAALLSEAGSSASYRSLAASVQASAREARLTGKESSLLAGLRPSSVLHDALAVWIAGGTVVLPGEAEQGDPRALWLLAESANVVRAYLPPALLRRLAEPGAVDQALPAKLRELIVDYGAGLAGESIDRLGARLAGVSIFERLLAADGLPALRRWPLAVGRPASRPRQGSAARILDQGFVPQPLGVPGEVYLVNERAARAEPTSRGGAVPAHLHPLAVLGRWLADGSIEILGPTAARLHLRGYEVDRDLVESLLRTVPGVREAAVASRGEQLLAFVEGTFSEAEARAKLVEHLPAFMVPGLLVQVGRLPRSWSGEVDREHLPTARSQQEAGSELGERQFAGPQTDLERAVSAACGDVLGGDEFGVRESIAARGGHCREAAQIAAILSDELGTRVTASDVLLHATVEGLAIALTNRSLAGEDDAERLLAELESLDSDEVAALLGED